MLEGIKQVIRQLVRAVRNDRMLAIIPPESPMDSDCMSVFLARNLRKAGCQVRFKFVKQPGMDTFHHPCLRGSLVPRRRVLAADRSASMRREKIR